MQRAAWHAAIADMTTANIITMVRIVLIPVFMVLAYRTDQTSAILTIAIFAIASLTDGLDGYIARKYKQVTNFGKFIDPLADKLLVMSALLIFVQEGVIPAWAVTIILAREFTVTSLRMVAAADGVVIQAAFWGKLKTFSQIICILILLYQPEPLMLTSWLTLQTLCIFIMVAVSVISGVDYVVNNFSVIRDGITQKPKAD